MKATMLVLLIFSFLVVACSSEVNTQKSSETSCVDSDGGKNPESFGMVKAIDAGNSHEIKDACIGDFYLVEAYCEGNQAKTENFICQKQCDPFDNVCF